uniref:Odorant receptor n=1 Tax=Bradysia odoriphaga TaxID=1564500 RepID=A0A6B9CAB7_9DIPT|nr:odorant receptor 28 [Bradysia odoriphaga]
MVDNNNLKEVCSIQMDKMLQGILKLFYQLGIWQSDKLSNFCKVGIKLFYISFVQAAVMAAVMYLKFMYILFKKQEILEFLNDPIVVHSIENREEYDQINKKIAKFMRFVRPYFLAICVTAVLLIVIKLPIFTTNRGLPFFISFSWNDSEIIYWLTYLVISVLMVLYGIVNFFSALIWYIMLNYSIEYQLLGNKLKNLGAAKNQTQKERISVAETHKCVENVIFLIKAHRNLTETVERFRSSFSALFLVHITTSGIVICVAVYSLAYASTENVLQKEMFVSSLLYGVVDIFLAMYMANEITDASDGLSYCLFKSNWIEQTESCKKYVLIMGEVLKQPQQLVILIYPMNLETFVKVIEDIGNVSVIKT